MYLTRRQKEILETIRGFITRKGYSPSLEEIAGAAGLSSVATVHKHLKNLEAKGLIARDEHRGRSVRLLGFDRGMAVEVPLLGLITAGSPIMAFEVPDRISLPESMLGRGETFVLKVEGESMIEDGILDGDLIIVESRNQASPGETVVALVHGEEVTVKRFYPEGRNVRLQPANRTMEPRIYPSEEVRIRGVVIGLMRKFQ